MPAEADEADECMAIKNLLEECASHAGDHEDERVESPWNDGRYRYTKDLLALQACRKAEREGTPPLWRVECPHGMWKSGEKPSPKGSR